MKTLAILSSLIAAGAQHANATLVFADDVADAETVDINGDVFEFDADSDVTDGNIAVDVSGGLTPAAASTAFAAAVNAASAPYGAVKIGNNVVVFHDYSNTPLTVAETLAAAGNVWAGETPGSGPGVIQVPVQAVREATASDVTAGNIAVAFGAPVESAAVDVRTSAGIPKAWVGATTVSGHLVIVDNSGATDFAAGDVVTITAKLAIVG